jgi:polyphosphate kinase
MLITSKKNLTKESQTLFEFMKQSYSQKVFQHLIVSPLNTRKKLEKLINNEIKNAKAKKEAYIYLKLNNLADPKIAELLYKAANAGVKIKLNIRAMCSITPQKNKNIEDLSFPIIKYTP